MRAGTGQAGDRVAGPDVPTVVAHQRGRFSEMPGIRRWMRVAARTTAGAERPRSALRAIGTGADQPSIRQPCVRYQSTVRRRPSSKVTTGA